MSDHEHIERARDTVMFCQAILQILDQAGDLAEADVMELKNMQRPAIAILQEYCAWNDWS